MLKKAQLAQGILVQWVETYQNQVEQFCLQIQLRPKIFYSVGVKCGMISGFLLLRGLLLESDRSQAAHFSFERLRPLKN